jgi:signal transduction histidine kinase
LSGFAKLEDKAVQQRLAQVSSTIQNDINALDMFVFDYAAWDDTYTFIQDTNRGYIDSNLVDETFSHSRINFILYIGTDGHLVYGKGYDLINETQTPVPQSLLNQIESSTLLTRHVETDSSVTGLIMFDDQPLVVASRPILTSEEDGPIHGTLIMARFLSDAEVAILMENSLVPFTIKNFEQTADDVAQALQKDTTLVIPLDRDTIAGYVLINDIYDQPAVTAEIQISRDIYRQGERSLLYLVLAILALGTLVGAAYLIMLEQTVLTRLTHLNNDVDRIKTTGDPSDRIHIPGQDELTNLADAINGMLEKLEQNQIEHERVETTLKQHAHTLAELNQLGQKLASSLSLQQIAEQLSNVVTALIDVEAVSVWLLDSESDRDMVCWAASNKFDPEQVHSPVDLHVNTNQGIVGWVMQHKQSVALSNPATDERFFSGVDKEIDFETRTLLAVPLQVHGNVIGVLEMVNKIAGEFTADDLNLAETLAASVAIAINNARLIKELRLYTVKLERRNAELDAFAHTVAHDLKNPLSVLTAFSTMLETDGPTMSTEDILKEVHVITKNAQRIGNIIDELLLLASVRKQDEVKCQPLDMASIVAETQERLEPMIAEYQGQVILPDTWPVAIGYGAWVQEVWANYLSNALKYGGKPPKVELGATEQGDTVRFWVHDNGDGLTQEEQETLFTEFTRLHQVRVEGYGLGLSIVRRIVEKLGGEVGVESQPGNGSFFYFVLPKSKTPSPIEE